MDLTPQQAEAFATVARRARGDRPAPEVARGVSKRLGFTVSHQSIYQWEKPGPSKPDSIDKVKALDDELGAGGQLLAIVAPIDEVIAARFEAVETRLSRQAEQLDRLERLVRGDR